MRETEKLSLATALYRRHKMGAVYFPNKQDLVRKKKPRGLRGS